MTFVISHTGPQPHLPSRGRCRGLSLIELMVSMTIGLILLAGMVQLLSNVSSARSEIDKSSRQIENGRYATTLLADDIRHAGYYGQYFSLPTPAALPDPCATADLQDSVALSIQGYDSPDATPLACLSDDDFVAGTDILVIRRARTVVEAVDSDPANPIAGLTATRAYIQSNSSAAPVIALGADANTAFTLLKKDPATGLNTLRADIRQYNVHIYFISPCSAVSCAANSNNISTLKRLELGDGVMNVVPLVDGVENMQIEYGIDVTPDTVNANTGLIGDGSPDGFETNPADFTAWSNVVAVRLFLLARNTEASAGYDDAKVYTLGSGIAGTVTLDMSAIDVPNNFDFRRHVFSALVRAVNPGSRREIP